MNKIVRVGKVQEYNGKCSVFCKIEIKDGALSITGVVGPKSNGDSHGSCGQINMGLDPSRLSLAPGWTRETVSRFVAVWDRWHLNDMRSGSSVQEQWLRDNPIPASEFAYPKSHYEVVCAKLAEAGLNPDPSGYNYGNAWNTERLPDEVVTFLKSLPDTDEVPAWV